jgi:hypothetical protein
MKIELNGSQVILTSENNMEALQLFQFNQNISKVAPLLTQEVRQTPTGKRGHAWTASQHAKMAKHHVYSNCLTCGKAIKGPAAMGSHVRTHKRKYQHSAAFLAKKAQAQSYAQDGVRRLEVTHA